MKNLIFIILPLLLFSCTKGSGNIYVEGKAYNPVTGEGMPNVKIELVRTNKPGAGDPIEGGGNAIVKTVHTNEVGEYLIEHLGALHGIYYILPTVDEGRYEVMGWESNNEITRRIDVSQETYDNLKVAPYGWISSHVKNVNCSGPSDSLNTNLTYLETGESNSNPFFTLGCWDHIYQPSNNKPAGEYRFDWYVIRNGVRTDSSKVFTVTEGDTTFVEIFY